MRNLFFIFCCFSTIFITGCMSTEKELPLVGKTFKYSDSKGHTANITFKKDNTVNGFAGVNNFFGEFRTSSDMIIFSNMGATKKAGSPDAMKFEDKFLSVLSHTNRFYEIGKTLTLFNGDMPILTLKLSE